jgi:uncharacterized membrane protein YozB (DUF420 family)
MRTADLVTASLLMLGGGVVIVDAVRLGIGWGTDGPQSGFLPFWLGALMITACAVILLRAAHRAAGRPFVTRQQLRLVGKVLWPAVALVVVTHWLGLYVSAALYTGLYMRWIGRHSWLAMLAVSILFLVSYLTYHYQVGSVKFTGQGWIRPAYFTILISHTILAAVIVPLALVTLSRALAARFDRHVRIARWTLPIWLYVSVTGVVVYWMLYHLYRPA